MLKWENCSHMKFWSPPYTGIWDHFIGTHFLCCKQSLWIIIISNSSRFIRYYIGWVVIVGDHESIVKSWFSIAEKTLYSIFYYSPDTRQSLSVCYLCTVKSTNKKLGQRHYVIIAKIFQLSRRDIEEYSAAKRCKSRLIVLILPHRNKLLILAGTLFSR